MRLLRQPYEESHVARNLGLLPTISEELRGLLPVAMLVDLLPLVNPLSEGNPSKHLNCNTIRDLNPELPAKPPQMSDQQRLCYNICLGQYLGRGWGRGLVMQQ